ncbi:hypothetical protein JTE90_019049 [Oedothorax gibbosus]|uniref:Putative WW-binding domain-containing protein n=1 Tax=Oedothorax gibbosus TaxID=931172 RepID=A0AAV6UYL2_9ARAC|nr:hypothetical protein JTE90_019049 [Oedothorax gibbosus]
MLACVNKSSTIPTNFHKYFNFPRLNNFFKMYLTDCTMKDRFNPEEYNDFKFWREPIDDVSLDDLSEVKVPKEIKAPNKEPTTPILSQYDAFMYWREPIPEIDVEL